MVTWQQIGQGEPNPFDVTYTTNSPYSASYGEFVITEGDQVDLPSPTPNGAVAVRSFKQTVTITTPSGAIRDIGSKVHLESPEYVLLVSDGTNWYVQSNESGIGRVIPDGEEFHYKFGANGLTDSSGNGNDLSGDSALVTKDGRDAYDVTGSNSATSSYSASNFSNSAFSFGLWFYTESLTADNDHFYYIENNYVIYRIFNGGFEIFFGPANGTDLVGVISTQTNTWVHAFLTYDGNSTGRVYRDGQKIEEASNLNDIQNRQNSTSIGGDPLGKPLTDTAFVDDVMLYERELSATEVNDIFNAQK